MPLRVHRFVSDRCFARVDVDKNGFLDPIEIEVAVLYLYNMVRCLHSTLSALHNANSQGIPA